MFHSESEHEYSFKNGQNASNLLYAMARATKPCGNCYSLGMASGLLSIFISTLSDEVAEEYLKSFMQEILKQKKGEPESSPSPQNERTIN